MDRPRRGQVFELISNESDAVPVSRALRSERSKDRPRNPRGVASGSHEAISRMRARSKGSRSEEMIVPPLSLGQEGRAPRGKLRKSGNVTSMELEDDDSPGSRPMDVVVDVHREYKGESVSRIAKSRDGAIGTLDETRQTNSEMFSQRKPPPSDRKSRDPSRKEIPRKPKKALDKPAVEDSLDLIEEFEDDSGDWKRKERSFDATRGARKSPEVAIKSASEEIPRRRKQWNASLVASSAKLVEESRWPPRKRWSKDTSVIRLPESKSVSSSASSARNGSSSRENGNVPRPVPAPRSSARGESFVAYDNPAFVSDTEEVLRIETDHNDRESAIIEMKSMKTLETVTVPSPRPDEFQLTSRKEDAVPTIENSEDSDNEGNVSPRRQESFRSPEQRGRSASRDDKPTSRRRRTNKKNTASDSNLCRSMEEISSGRDSADVTSSEENVETVSRSSRSSRKGKLSSGGKIVSANEGGSSRDLSEKGSARTIESEGNERRASETSSSALTRVSRTPEEPIERETRKKNDNNKKNKNKRNKKRQRTSEEVKYISVTIHRADVLEIDYTTRHPMVKVHVVEAETGRYPSSAENGELRPIITGQFDFRENRSMVPIWEEELVFEHDFEAIVRGEKQVVILFELLDLLSFAEASDNYDKFGSEACWYKIAWAFLKPVGANNTMHTGKKVRLQLYRRPRRDFKKLGRHQSEVYTWWKSNSREKYPSSLFVTVTSVDRPRLEPVIYQQLSLNDLSDARSEQRKVSMRALDTMSLPKWTRLAAQSCKIPNARLFETEISENGSFFVAFSNDGKHLACVNSEEYDYPIVVYEMATAKIHVRFSGHKTFVYSLDWSLDDFCLLSVSSDQTARVWDARNKTVQHVHLLPHPSYVYCGKFDPGDASTIATGCYDRVVRIWVKDNRSDNYELGQELEGHEGFVNSICFQKEGGFLTADSVGTIVVWQVRKNRRRREWHASRKIRVREIEGTTINTIALHPLESRLLVHSRDNGLWMLDLATGVVLRKYKGLNNRRIQCTACTSPCGGLILCGGEDSTLNVWSLETGKYLARYTIERNYRAVTCVDYHPYDHVLAFCTFGSPAPVRVIRFDKDATGQDVGLRSMIDEEPGVRGADVSLSLLNASSSSRLNRTRSTADERHSENLSSRSRQVRLRRSTETLRGEDDGRRDDARSKLRRLNETEKSLKTRSTGRLYRIIEKIDRILSNASRSSDDVEAGHGMEKVSASWIADLSVEDEKSRAKSSSGSREELETSETSTGTFKSPEPRPPRDTGRSRKVRSKSASVARRTHGSRADTPKTLSDGATTSRKALARENASRAANWRGSPSAASLVLDSTVESEDSPTSGRASGPVAERENNSDSGGTYVVEKADFEKNDDRNPAKAAGSDDSARDAKALTSVSDAGSSARSNATFLIENELPPVPRPRKKRTIT